MKIHFLTVPTCFPSHEGQFSSDPQKIKPFSKPYPLDFSDENGEFFPWAHNNYDEDTIKYVKLLECDSEFEDRIKKIRKKFSIPVEGYKPSEKTKYRLPFSSSIPLEEQVEVVNKEYEKIKKECLEIFKDYKIPFAIKNSLFSVVISNYIDIASSYSFHFEKDPDEPKVNLSIEIHSPMQSCNKIKKDLDLYWPDIVKLISEDSSNHIKLPDMPSIEIWNIRKRLNWSYKKITEVVNKRYGLDLDESEARKRMDYMRKAYKKISPK